MSYLIIEGGKKLSGLLPNQSAKNSAVSILCASIMVKGKVVLTDVPEIEEVNRIVELITSIGVKVEKGGRGKYTIDSSGELELSKIDRRACEAMRSSLFLFGALSSRVKKYKLYKAGGCKLGDRTIKPHTYALEKLGIVITSGDDYYEVRNEKLQSAYIVMYETSDTATENAIMGAVLASGVTTIKMASANYMVQDLCYFLERAGAKIEGIGTSTLKITGVKELQPVEEYPIMPDPIVAMTYIAAGIITRSNVTVTNCPLEFLELEFVKLEKMGQKLILSNKRFSKNNIFEVVDVQVLPGRLIASPVKIEGRPFPGLNIDNLPFFVPIAAVAEGRTMIHDWAYENRAVYSLELQKLGAKVTLLDPHRLWVEGPAEFVPAEMDCPTALRPGVNVLLAMLAAKGRSILRNTYMIDRGYENLYDTLCRAGADIRVMQETVPIVQPLVGSNK